VADLTGLDADLRTALQSCRVTTFITSHAAFGYFADRYGLTQVGISGVEPDVEPSAARIAAVQQIAIATGVTTIFFETLASPEVADAIAGDLGLTTDVLDPLEGITSASRGTDYLEVMHANGAALRKANSCS
jgi:zinc transport system substrate-binding protein